MSQRARRATVALYLGFPSLAVAGITSPSDEPNGFYDVYGPGAPLEWTSTWNCTLGPASGTKVGVAANDPRTFTTSDAAGLWELTCDGDTFTFYQGTAHRALWLQHNAMVDLATEYAGRSELVLFFEEYNTAPSTNVDLTRDERWVHDTAWYYLLNVALPGLAYESGGTRIPALV